ADPAVAEAMQDARTPVAAVDGVVAVIDPFIVPEGPSSPAAAPLLAADGAGFLVVAELDPTLTDAETAAAADELAQALRDVPGRLQVAAPDASGLVGGSSLIEQEIVEQIERDLTTGEAFALPVALLVMVVVFGGFLAAAMPMAGAL